MSPRITSITRKKQFNPCNHVDRNTGNNIAVDPNIVLKKLSSEDLTIRNAPGGGHTCITAGEQGEPADYE